MQTDVGGNGPCFVYFDGAGLHGFFAPSGNQGRPVILTPARIGMRVLPLVLGSLFWHAGQGGRTALSWQHFEEPSAHGGLKTLQKEPLAGGHRKYIHI
jgi:hypothetical protein